MLGFLSCTFARFMDAFVRYDTLMTSRPRADVFAEGQGMWKQKFQGLPAASRREAVTRFSVEMEEKLAHLEARSATWATRQAEERSRSTTSERVSPNSCVSGSSVTMVDDSDASAGNSAKVPVD